MAPLRGGENFLGLGAASYWRIIYRTGCRVLLADYLHRLFIPARGWQRRSLPRAYHP